MGTRDRNREPDNTSEDAELESALTLLSKLKKQYRMMERNRRQYYDETKVLITRQRKMVADLGLEKSLLEENLKVSRTPRNHVRDMRARNTMSAILDRQSYYERAIENEKNKITDLDASVKVLEKQLRDHRFAAPSTRLLELEREACNIANSSLENRIQQTTVRLNSVLAQNTSFRHTIENQLKERDKFILQARKLEKSLSSSTKRKGNLMDEVAKAYTERDEAQTKMKSLRERIDRDNLKYSKEMKKIQRAIDYQANLRAFVTTIAAEEDDEALRRKEGEEIDEKGLEATLENYRQSIAHLEETSGETSLDALISNYLQAENDNYTVFSYISDLNNEITGILSDVRKLQQEIDEVKGPGRTQVSKENTSTLGNLTEELAELRKEVGLLEENVAEAETMLVQVKEATSEIFHAVHCNPKPVEALVGGSEVTSSNLCMFLSVIEQRVKELSRMRELLEKGASNWKMGQNSNELDTDSETESSPSSLAKGKPAIPHMGHLNEEDTFGPTTHTDLLSSFRITAQEASKTNDIQRAINSA